MITGQKHLYGSVTYRLYSESRDRRGNRLPFLRASYPSSTGRVGSNERGRVTGLPRQLGCLADDGFAIAAAP